MPKYKRYRWRIKILERKIESKKEEIKEVQKILGEVKTPKLYRLLKNFEFNQKLGLDNLEQKVNQLRAEAHNYPYQSYQNPENQL